ncbi:rCG41691 [Rattus norvegicus]|uniref:RCG41691 n=1 Tax=Rattus norvegicus TaxID=10116 RepID=A6KRF6_RAT|nr:rCG41691 [Rattus norvegicus]
MVIHEPSLGPSNSQGLMWFCILKMFTPVSYASWMENLSAGTIKEGSYDIQSWFSSSYIWN